MADGRPTDDMLALAAFLIGRPWVSADEIRGAVCRLGFPMPSIQFTSARLVAMCKESAPRFERRREPGWTDYNVTTWAAQGLRNQWPGFVQRGWCPTPKPEGGGS